MDIDTLIFQGQLIFGRIPFLWHVFSARSQIIEGDLCITKGTAMVATKLLGMTKASAVTTKQRLNSIINQKSADVKQPVPARKDVITSSILPYFKRGELIVRAWAKPLSAGLRVLSLPLRLSSVLAWLKSIGVRAANGLFIAFPLCCHGERGSHTEHRSG